MERQNQHTETPGGVPEGDMDVEDWLTKQQILSSTNGEPQNFEGCSVVPISAIMEQGYTPLHVCHYENRIELERNNGKNQSLLSRSEPTVDRSFINNLFVDPPQPLNAHDLCNRTTTSANDNASTGIGATMQQPEQTQLQSTMPFDAALTIADATAMDAHVELSVGSTVCRDQQQQRSDTIQFTAIANHSVNEVMLVAAKRVVGPRGQQLFVICIVLGAILCGGVTAIGLLMFNSSASEGTDSISPTEHPGDEVQNQSMSSLPFARRDAVNATIGDFFGSFIGNSVLSVGLLFESGQIYLKILNRLDTKFTVVSFRIDLLPGALHYTVLERYSDPIWNGHTLNLLLNRIIEGQSLAYSNITDGLIVYTMAGYPVEFFKYPNFTINGDVVEVGDIHYTNGIAHNLAHVPDPLVPWLYKSNYDVLLEVNMQQNGNLSHFIALINASALKDRLMMEDSTKPITLFVPTNEAMATIVVDDSDNISNVSSSSYQLLLNHVVQGNFVIRDWLRIPTGKKVSETELQLTTDAGNVLEVVLIAGERVRINGMVNIMKEDVFSFYGVLQIIDLPLIGN